MFIMNQMKFSLQKLFHFIMIICFIFLLPACKNDKNGKNYSGEVSNDTTSQAANDALFKKYNLDKIKLPAGI